jgi:hypothetical protein
MSSQHSSNTINLSSNFENYLIFLNELEFSSRFSAIVESYKQDDHFVLSGWQGLECLICLSENNELYEVDIRYAWGEEIFQQNAIDYYIDSEDKLIYKKNLNKFNYHKLIIYLCESSTNLNCLQKIQVVPRHFAIAQRWQSIHHLYLLLPISHPFSLPKNLNSQANALRNRYATTRYLQKEKRDLKFSETIAMTRRSCYSFSEPKQEGGLRIKGLSKISTTETPLITIITVIFNGEKYLEQTIQSVINQTYPNIEYLIIDGNSTDGTLDIIRKYEDKINYWLSAPDCGVYDAMNKGWELANNDSYILFLGAGDIIISLPTLEKSSKDIIFGRAIKGETGFYKTSSSRLRLKLGNTIHHQSLLIHKSWCQTFPFELIYKVYADYDFNSRLLKQGANFVFKKELLAYALPAGLSDRVYIRELLKIIRNHYGIFWMIVAAIYHFYQGIRYGFERISIDR